MSRNVKAWIPGPNITKYKKKPPGPKSEYVRRRFTDMRTREGKALLDTINGLRDDLGTVSRGQEIILANLSAQLSVVRAISRWIDRQESVIGRDGRLLHILQANFITYCNAIQRSVRELYDLAGKKPQRTVDLESYLAGKKSAEGSGE